MIELALAKKQNTRDLMDSLWSIDEIGNGPARSVLQLYSYCCTVVLGEWATTAVLTLLAK